MENKIADQQPQNIQIIQAETVTQLVRRHMRDKNHTTTEEELRNVRLELSGELDERRVVDGNLRKK